MPRPRSSSRIQRATLSRKYRSWVTATTVPGYSCRNRSSQRDRLGVEVVGGLVEQQQIGSRQQQPAERDPASLTAGEHAHLGVARRAPQGVHGDLDVALDVPRAGRVDLVLERGLLGTDLLEVGIGVAPHRQHLVVPLEQGLGLADAVHDVAEHVLRRVEPGLLREVADREPRGQAGLADEAVIGARHDAEERRLARAVGAQHPDLGPRVEGQADVREHLAVGRVEAAELVGREDELRRHDRSTLPMPGQDRHR